MLGLGLEGQLQRADDVSNEMSRSGKDHNGATVDYETSQEQANITMKSESYRHAASL